MTATRSRNGSMNGMAEATREITQAQRERYEALAQNFDAFQRQSLELVRGGIEFLELQERNVRAVQQWWESGLRLMQLQQRNASFLQSWLSRSVELWMGQTERNRRTAEVFAESARRQQEGFWKLAESWAGSYQNFFLPFAYARESLEVVQEATEQVAGQGLRLAEEAERMTRRAELKATVHGALKTGNYDELTVAEVSRRLDGLSREELEKVREYEKQSKNRETLLEEIDRKIKAAS